MGGPRVFAPLMVAALCLGTGSADTGPHSSRALALTDDGSTLLVVNPDSGTMTIVAAAERSVIAEVAVGEDPRCIAVDRRGIRAYVTNRGSASVSVIDLPSRHLIAQVAVGAEPYGIVVAPDGRVVWIAEQGASQLRVLDTETLATLQVVSVGPRPSGLALAEGGATLLVTHLLSGRVTVVDRASRAVTGTIPLYVDSNLAQAVVVSPDDTRAYLPHTRSNTSNPALTFDTTVFPLVSVIDLPTRSHMSGKHISLDTVDPPGVGLPFDAALDPTGTELWVVNAASNDLTVVDLVTRRRRAHIEVGDNPRAIVLSADGGTAYVNNTLAGTVSVIDTATATVTEEVGVTRIPLPPVLLAGKRLFNSSDDPRLARAQWIACTSCHFDGEHDGRTWTFGFAGPRNTTSLLGMIQTYPLRWSAEWDEAADSEFAITREQFGPGLLDGGMHETLGSPNGGRSLELDSLAAFLDSLPAPRNPGAAALDPASVQRGATLFHDAIVACAGCHPRPYGTDFLVHDVGTAEGPEERLGAEIDTPGLRDLARSAPYLHDGSAATLLDVLTAANPDDEHGVTSHLGAAQLQDLVAYMLAWPPARDACLDCDTPSNAPATAHARQALPQMHATATAPRGPARRAGSPLSASGRVVDAATGAPVADALVTLRATGISTRSTTDGTFQLLVAAPASSAEITAWAPGTYIAYVATPLPVAGLELRLRSYHTNDNPDYEWIDPSQTAGPTSACGNCHPSPLQQWQGNAHGGAVTNPRFYSFYNGTDVAGTTTVAPGYLLDFPGTAGVCATCHAPGAAVDAPHSTDMNAIRGEITAGVHCDFCHKIGGAYLRRRSPTDARCQSCHDDHGGLLPPTLEVYRNAPGVHSYQVLRPPAGEQIFIGPYPDIHDPDTYLPLLSESAFCAPCHEFSFWGTPIYTSYGEWLASPWSDPDSGRTCQSCHMTPTGDTYFAPPEKGGLPHPPATIPSHLQLGVRSQELMQATVDLGLDAAVVAGELRVSITITNSGAGHHVPTDHPGRHLLLIVEAEDATGTPLPLLAGTTIPAWGGSWAGSAGRGFAKLLRDAASGESPVVSYWKQTIIVQDTRLPAFATDTSSYSFAAPTGTATVTARVIFRRLFEPIADRYGWPLDEMVMEEASVSVD